LLFDHVVVKGSVLDDVWVVEFDDIDEVSFQVKKELVVSIYCFKGENLASFLVKAFFDIPMSAFAYLFPYRKFSFKVFGIDRF
jgi:hypothetical protein